MAGACDITLTAEHRGIRYDPGLVSRLDIDELFACDPGPSFDNHDLDLRVSMLVEHMHRIRASADWPSHVDDLLQRKARDNAVSRAFKGVKPRTSEYYSLCERYATHRYFKGTHHERIWNERQQAEIAAAAGRKAEAKRNRHRWLTVQKNMEEALALRFIEWHHGGSPPYSTEAARKARAKQRTEQRRPHRGRPKKVDFRNGQWVPLMDPQYRGYIKKTLAYEAAKYIEAQLNNGLPIEDDHIATIQGRDKRRIRDERRRTRTEDRGLAD
jgi:hypothetical protein